jgi:hypothetical protein
MKTVIKYPRLVTLLKHQCSLTETEAIGLLERRIGEAVSHYGGRDICLVDAIRSRHRLYKQFNGSPLEFWFYRRDRSTLFSMGF